LPTVSPADPRSELGLRSLDPDRSFWSAFAELIRGQPSPTDFCNCVTTCGQPNPSSWILAGTETSISFLFFYASRCLPCGSGDARRAALRPLVKAPVKVPPGYPGFPDRDASSNAPPPRLAPAEHSEDRRARVEGPSEGRVPGRMRRSLVPASGACALSRMQTAFPSSASSGHPLSSARILPREDTHDSERTDLGPRSNDAPRREPPSRRPGCLSPPRHAKEFLRGEIAPSGLRAGSPAHAAHTSPQLGDSALEGHCEVTVRSPAGP
jgi:hypothetical protein